MQLHGRKSRLLRVVAQTLLLTMLLGCLPLWGQADDSSDAELASDVDTVELNEAELYKALGDLNSRRFRHRDAAFLTLVRGGRSSLETLEKGAKSSDAEVRMRCVEALLLIARNKKLQSDVIASLDRLAADETPGVAELVEEHLEQLRMSDQERAIAALKSQGVRIYQQQNGTIYSLSLMRDRHLAWLKFFPKLQSVNISGMQVTDAGLEHLAQMPALSNLSISQTRISDSGLAKLESLTNLRTISLRADEFTGRGLRHLGKIPQLIHVSLSSTVDDDDLRGLVDVRQINSLYMSEISLTSASVELLNRLDHVRQCNLTLRNVDELDLRWLADVTLPISLNLSSAGSISDAGWKHLRRAQLEMLSVSGAKIDDRVLAGISEIEALKRLNLSGSMSITEKGWAHFQDSKLDSLSLSGVKILEGALAGISQIETLRSLNLNGSAAIQSEGWKHLRNSKLQVLSVGGVQVSDQDLAHIATIQSLRNLTLSGSSMPVTDEGIEQLSELSSLQSLYLRGTKVSQEAGERLKEKIKSLRSVTIR